MHAPTDLLSAPRPARRLPWRWPLAAALVLLGLWGAWLGGWAGLLGAAGLVAGVGLGLGLVESRSGARAADGAAPVPGVVLATGAPAGPRQGAEVMVSQVVPVWSRQLEVTRDAGSDGLSNLLQAFSGIDAALNQLASNLASFSVTAVPGAVGEAVRQETPALQALTAASARAFAQRDAAVAELGQCAEGLGELQQLAKQARELSRHTRLVAFNASIESNRQGSPAAGGNTTGSGRQGGTQAVASELRMLSGRIAETAEQIERVVSKVSASVRRARRDGEVGDTSDEELRLEIEMSANEALNRLLAAVGASVHSGSAVQQAATALTAQLEAIFVQFQFGDRVSQMLSIIANDMGNFAAWVKANPRATQTDAAEWLATLEASYTMEEQRSTHHGNAHIDQGAAVEFF